MKSTLKWHVKGPIATVGFAVLVIAVACGGADGPNDTDNDIREIDLPEGIPDIEATTIEPDSPTSSGMLVPRAQTVEELVDRSKIVVVGTIASVKQEFLFGGYDENGQPESFEDEEGTQYTDFVVEVDQLLKGDGIVVEGGTFILRLFGHRNPSGTQVLSIEPILPDVGDSLVFALGTNPDGTYGSGPDGLIEVDTGRPVFIDGQPFPGATGAGEFINAIAEAVAN